MQPIVQIAIRAARRAGEVIRRQADRLDRIRVEEKAPHDFVSEVDRAAEAAIVEVIRAAHPDHAILAEEGGLLAPAGAPGEERWIVDPLDGTTNFLHGFPVYAVSIAFERRGVLEAGVVYDPTRDELFVGSRGEGALLNDRRIRVAKRIHLDEALIGTGFPFRDFSRLGIYLEQFRALLPQVAGVRRAGSAALDLAAVAAGRLDGFFELGLKPWDLAAGLLLIQEAGGVARSFGTEGTHPLESGDVIAANPRLLAALAALLNPFYGRSGTPVGHGLGTPGQEVRAIDPEHEGDRARDEDRGVGPDQDTHKKGDRKPAQHRATHKEKRNHDQEGHE
jgi:myo-inositol-1(or 4)-monophosphatase